MILVLIIVFFLGIFVGILPFLLLFTCICIKTYFNLKQIQTQTRKGRIRI
jgi:hypothetical protein